MTEINHGVIKGSGTKNLWFGGTIKYEVVNPIGDWRPYVTTHEKQEDPLETMACVSFSCNNVLETQYKFFGIDVNFSDRFLAKMSGTTPQGNYLDKVADTARLVGLVPESVWPNTKIATWAEYYKDIPQNIIQSAVKQQIQFESIGRDKATLQYHLKQSPVQITIPYPHSNHAVTLLAIEGDRAYYQDHYNYQIKYMSVDKIDDALKIVLTKPNMNEFARIINYKGTIIVGIAAESLDSARALGKAFGKEVKIDSQGNITNADIKID